MENLRKTLGVSALVVFSVGCGLLTATPALPTVTAPPPSETPAPRPSVTPSQPAARQGLFDLFQTAKVTPAGNFRTGIFVRIGYVPGRDAMVVAFDTMLNGPEGDCGARGYAYREFNLDMAATGEQGLINCYGGAMDTGGLFVGDDFYFAYQSGKPDGTMGWMLAKYDAVTWQPVVPPAYFGLEGLRDPGDPMIAEVNGRIDISSKIRTGVEGDPDCPYVACWTHHQIFTTDLEWVGERILKETIHVNLTSLVQTPDGTIHFLTATNLFGDMLVLQYKPDWTFVDAKTVKLRSATPEGVAFDGRRFYVAYTDVTLVEKLQNVHLAVFDTDWNLIDDIAVTSFVPEDRKAPARPSLAMHNNRIYVCYDQAEQSDVKTATTEEADVQAYVKVYNIRPESNPSG